MRARMQMAFLQTLSCTAHQNSTCCNPDADATPAAIAPPVPAGAGGGEGGSRAVKRDAGDNDDKNYNDAASGGTTSFRRGARPVTGSQPWASTCERTVFHSSPVWSDLHREGVEFSR